MNILGISGLEGAVPFKRRHFPSLDEREYRVSQGHDAAAALVCNGSIMAAAAQERFDRKKHSPRLPIDAIRWCLGEAGLSLGDVDAVVHGFDYGPYRELYSIDPTTAALYADVLSKESLLALVKRDAPEVSADRVHQIPHHLAHAASAYFTSGWDECLVLVVDAMGEAHGWTAFTGQGGTLTQIRSQSAHDSIGILYSLVTLHLGFDFNSDEYKIMGLAPYGDRARFRGFFRREVERRPDGTIRIPMLRLNRSREEREGYLATRAELTRGLVPPRAPTDPVEEVHRDIAAALQECLEEVMLHMSSALGRETGQRRLAMAGGVALNCTSNGRLIRSGTFDEIYIQPAAGDDGTALGAALCWAAQHDEVENRRMPAPLLGPSYNESTIATAIADSGNRIRVHRFESREATCERAAALIADGAVLAWYRGRMEFGPRALGNRSILADPGHPEMRDRINAMVKKREAFRPFAPAVSLEEVDRWFDVAASTAMPYMISIVDVRPEWRAQLPAITHVNGSARVQTVSAADNPDFHTLLEAVGRTTGRRMVLNTSFNVKGQPIVNTPAEAIDTFLGTGIDYLFLEDYLVTRAD